ncbi:hypothetical protein B0J18DRAFT_439631 [Chaetomium sp. MPI-SDFR-AT-0129]|nr:hypothetical protein B0J18DRAFT_439631 [Chaetomium sp. MPI-SDFR-AT-0129]
MRSILNLVFANGGKVLQSSSSRTVFLKGPCHIWHPETGQEEKKDLEKLNQQLEPILRNGNEEAEAPKPRRQSP